MREEDKKLWHDACHHLKKTLREEIFDKWIAVIHCREIIEDKAILVVGNDFYRLSTRK